MEDISPEPESESESQSQEEKAGDTQALTMDDEMGCGGRGGWVPRTPLRQ